MKNTLCAFVAAVLLAALAPVPGFAQAHDSGKHVMVQPSDLQWSDVPSLPPGAKIAVIEGPMSQAVPFTARLRLPADYAIPPHSHPAIEHVTVISGTFHMGTGDRMDRTRTMALRPGAVAIMDIGTRHFAWTAEPTEIQIHGVGPWAVNYVNPEDDPRRKK